MLKKILFVCCLLVCNVFLACKSTAVYTDPAGERNQYVRGRLDSTIKSLDRELTGADEALRECTERSRGIEDLGARLKYLTSEYFRITKQIQDANNRAISELDSMEKDLQDTGNNTSDTDNNSRNSVIP